MLNVFVQIAKEWVVRQMIEDHAFNNITFRKFFYQKLLKVFVQIAKRVGRPAADRYILSSKFIQTYLGRIEYFTNIRQQYLPPGLFIENCKISKSLNYKMYDKDK